jgi:drug/metabolite transporter (DMT)-like permease
MKSEKFKITVGYILICLIWGSTWLTIRLSLDSLTPFISCGIRFILAALSIYVVMRLKNIKLQTDPVSIKMYVMMTFFSYIIPYGFVYWAEQFIPSGLTSIIYASMPFYVILFSFIAFSKQSVTRFQIIGTILAFGGILVIFLENLSIDLSLHMKGIIVLLIGAGMQSGIAVMVKKFGGHLNPFSMSFVPLFTAGIGLVIMAFMFENSTAWNFNLNAILSIIYLAVFGTVIAFTVYYWLIQKISVVLVSLSSFITPIIAVLLGWLILDEKLSFQTLIGSGMVLIGILFANFTSLKNINFVRQAAG